MWVHPPSIRHLRFQDNLSHYAQYLSGFNRLSCISVLRSFQPLFSPPHANSPSPRELHLHIAILTPLAPRALPPQKPHRRRSLPMVHSPPSHVCFHRVIFLRGVYNPVCPYSVFEPCDFSTLFPVLTLLTFFCLHFHAPAFRAGNRTASQMRSCSEQERQYNGRPFLRILTADPSRKVFFLRLTCALLFFSLARLDYMLLYPLSSEGVFCWEHGHPELDHTFFSILFAIHPLLVPGLLMIPSLSVSLKRCDGRVIMHRLFQ